jgi:ornithine--oxo-acid transaminase
VALKSVAPLLLYVGQVAHRHARDLLREPVRSRALQLLPYLKAGLKAVCTDVVREVRGRGLMLAVELHKEAGLARDYVEALARQGVLTKDAHDQTIRIAPPLIVTREEADWAIERFAAALKSAPRPRRKPNSRPLSVASQV